MIYKDLDPFSSEDKFARAGRSAEEQMAFYLKRFFGNDPDILVLNGIRLEFGGDAAQVDHLVIHSHGLSIVESKSVHGKIQIKDDGQWLRWYGTNQSRGMASPITQARLQERFFRDVLGRASKNPDLFRSIPIDLYVAISDSGVILWPKSGPIESVCKADQVADKLLAAHATHAAKGSALELSRANREKIAEFLVKANKPLRRSDEAVATETPSPQESTASVAPPVESTSTEPDNVTSSGAPSCRNCGKHDLEIRYGYSYYLYCKACENNTPIKPLCPSCGETGRLRKQKKEFFVDCEKCNSSSLYYTNP